MTSTTLLICFATVAVTSNQECPNHVTSVSLNNIQYGQYSKHIQYSQYFQNSQYSQYNQYSLESRGNCTVDCGSCTVYALLCLIGHTIEITPKMIKKNIYIYLWPKISTTKNIPLFGH